MPTSFLVNKRAFRKVRGQRALATAVQFPAFSFPTLSWRGASYCVGTLSADPGFTYSFNVPIALQSNTFAPVIRWFDGEDYQRRILWRTGYEIVPFGDYTGEAIQGAPVLEIWTVQGQTTAAMPSPWLMDIGLLTQPTSISDQTQTIFPV